MGTDVTRTTSAPPVRGSRHGVSLSSRLGKFAPWVRSPLPWFVLVNIPFFFIFYDVWNLNTVAYAGSYLALGLNPYRYGNVIPGGLPIQLLGLMVYQTYELSQRNFLATAAVLKALYLVLTYFAGWILGWIARAEGLPYHRKIRLAFLFSPFILFVNNVWVETDIIIILLYLLGFAALHYGWERRGELRFLILGVLCIALGVFSYYSIILLIPTLILFRGTLRKKLQTLVAFAIAGAVLAIPLVFFGLVGGGIAPSLLSASSGISPFSLFNLVLSPKTAALSTLDPLVLVLIGAMAIVVPILFRQVGLPESTSLLVSYAGAYLLFINNVQGDNFVLLIGLVLLAVISLRRPTVSYWRLFALQLFVVPQLVIVLMLNGINGAVGVYYWSYYQFHATENLYMLLGGRPFWHELLGAYLAVLLLTLSYLVVAGLRGPRAPVNPDSYNADPKRILPIRRQALFAGTVAIIVLASVALPVGVSYDSGVRPYSISVTGFDQGLFVPYAYGENCTGLPECAYQLSSSNTFSVADHGAAVEFAGSSIPIGLYRNVTDQSFTINVSANVPWQSNYTTPGTMDVINTSSFYAGVANEIVVANGSTLVPTNSSQYSSVVFGTTNVIAGSKKIFQLNGTGYVNYQVPTSGLPDHEVVFGAELTNHSMTQDSLWSLQVGSVTYEAYYENGFFTLAYRTTPSYPWISTYVPLALPLHRWFLAGYSVDANGSALSGFVNGINLTTPFYPSANPVTIMDVGKANSSSSSDYQEALTGNVTEVYSIANPSIAYRQGVYAWTPATGITTTFPAPGTVALMVAGSDRFPRISFAGQEINVGPFPALWVGKLTSSPSPLRLTFTQLSFSSNLPGPNLLPIVIGFGGILPAAVIGCCLWPTLAHWLARRFPRGRETGPNPSPPV
jgi:hypothetical protein